MPRGPGTKGRRWGHGQGARNLGERRGKAEAYRRDGNGDARRHAVTRQDHLALPLVRLPRRRLVRPPRLVAVRAAAARSRVSVTGIVPQGRRRGSKMTLEVGCGNVAVSG
jgi:hypothetical protein